MSDQQTARYSLILGVAQQNKLAAIAKQYKISQQVVMETMLDNLDEEKFGVLFAAKRAAVVEQRERKKSLLKQLKNLTPEQMALVQQLSST